MAIPTFTSSTDPRYRALVDAGYGPYMQSLAQDDDYDLEEQILTAQALQARDEIHNLTLAIAAAKRTGDTAAVTGLQAQVAYWLQRLGVTNKQAGDAARPSAFMLRLSQFSDDAINTAKSAGVAVDDLVKQLGALLKTLPKLVWVAVAIVGAVVIWKLWQRYA